MALSGGPLVDEEEKVLYDPRHENYVRQAGLVSVASRVDLFLLYREDLGHAYLCSPVRDHESKYPWGLERLGCLCLGGLDRQAFCRRSHHVGDPDHGNLALDRDLCRNPCPSCHDLYLLLSRLNSVMLIHELLLLLLSGQEVIP